MATRISATRPSSPQCGRNSGELGSKNWTDSSQGCEHIDVAGALQNLDTNADCNFVKMAERIVPTVAFKPEIVYQQRKQLTSFKPTILNEVAMSWPMNFVELKNQAHSIGDIQTAAGE